MTKPTPSEINELLATKAGWLLITDSKGRHNIPPWMNIPKFIQIGEPHFDLPDYYNDLNAIHSLENLLLDYEIMDSNSPRYAYSREVYNLCPLKIQPFRAPASIRAEALARVFFPTKFKE